MAKPKPDLDKLSIPKAKAAAAIPFAAEAKPGSKSLTVRLSHDDYWRLRDYCAQRERQSGERMTHQDAMVMGLHCLLAKEAA
jgi:hypothetical protein